MEIPSPRLVAARLAVASLLVFAGTACVDSPPGETVGPIQLVPTSTASTPAEHAGALPVDPPDPPPAGGATEEEPEDTATTAPPTRREEPAPAGDDGDDSDDGDDPDDGDDRDDEVDADDSDGDDGDDSDD